MNNCLKIVCSLLVLSLLCAKVSANNNICPASVTFEKGKFLTVIINNRTLKASEPASEDGKGKLVFAEYEIWSQEYGGARVATCLYARNRQLTSNTIVSVRNSDLSPNLNNPEWADGKRVLPPMETLWVCYPRSTPCDWVLKKSMAFG